ncbi:MAG: BrnA antitoxin family protein [Sphingomonadaceae bacterium]|nr:BrnA antitoxin family protein [Sphingomonadaceae bacterium]
MSKTKYTQTDLAAVSDNPEWRADDFAKAVPFDKAFPDLAATIKRRGAQKAPTKVSTTIRLSREVVDHFRTTGSGWQARIDKALKEWIETH